jgi:hypothetical protein
VRIIRTSHLIFLGEEAMELGFKLPPAAPKSFYAKSFAFSFAVGALLEYWIIKSNYCNNSFIKQLLNLPSFV